MMKRNRFSFFISLALHFTAATLLFFLFQVRQLPLIIQKSVLIEIADAPQSQKSATGEVGSYSRQKMRGRSHSFQLKDLGVKYGWQIPAGKKSNPGQSRESDHGESNAVDIVQEGRQSPLVQYIRDQVENNLAYPAELKQRLIEGSVNGAVVFSKGEFVEDQTRLQSDSSFLKVAVMRALRKAFRSPLPEKYWKLAGDSAKGDGRVEVQSRFVFAVVEHDEDQKSQSFESVSGRAIAFYRTYVHSKLEWKMGPLSGLGPLVSLDVLWLPEKILGILSKKAEIDPLDSYRDDPAW